MAEDLKTVKIYASTREKIDELIKLLAHEGWSSVGVDRRESNEEGSRSPFTVANVIDGAIDALMARKKRK